MTIHRSFLLLLALLLPGTAAAQAQPPPGYVAVRGTVRDSATGASVQGVQVSVGRGWVGKTDASGEYVLFAPPGVHPVRIDCPSSTWAYVQRLSVTTVEIRAGSPTAPDLRIDRRACTEPPPDSIDAELVGHYSTGFEESRFVPCPGTVERAWGRALYARNYTWVRFDSTARATGPKTWPTPDTSGYGHRYFVRWRGRLIGPGSYGHFGIAPYLFRVHRIVQVRTPASGDCG